MAVAGLHNVSAFGPSFFGESRPNTRASALVRMWRELENEHVINQSIRSRRQIRNGSDTECSTTPKSIIGQGSENGDDISRHSFESENQDEHEDSNSIVSDDLGEAERERVRQIFREWMSNGSKVHSSNGQIFCGPEMVARPIRRLCGRQTLLDLLMRAQTEQKNELSGLAERRPVSEFAHRNRIQALLRGRFLRNETVVRDERPSSRGATELGLLRQRHTVSDLREGFLSKLEKCVSTTSLNSAEAESESTTSSDSKSVANVNRNVQELETQVTEVDNNVQHDEVLGTEDGNESSLLECEVINGKYDRTTDLEFDSQDTSAQVEGYREPVIEIENNNSEMRSDEEDDDSRDDDDLAAVFWQEGYSYDEPFDNNVEEINQESSLHLVDWPNHDLQEAIDTWLDMPSGRVNTFYPPDDDDGAHGMEIRELFSRRRVSSLLGSSFRESLDQVIQSHIERLVSHASGEWEIDNNNTSFPALIEQEQEHEQEREQEQQQPNGADGNEWNLFAASQQPLWEEEEFQDTNWSRPNSNMHLETELEVINELRIDMARLQQRMNNMQSMLEACMEMQIELQRSVCQDLSAALNWPVFSSDEEEASEDNRLPNDSQLDFVRKGICCVCHDSKIDSMLYRCGHMCACSKCADNLVQCKGKCPMCRAPAVEAVQAYFSQ